MISAPRESSDAARIGSDFVDPMDSKPFDNQQDIEKNNEISQPEFTHRQPLAGSVEIGKSFSAKLFRYLSSKMNEIVPEENEDGAIHEILQAGGTFSHKTQDSAEIPISGVNETLDS